MALLAYWQYDNYCRDLDQVAGFHFNSNQPGPHSALEPGERPWLVTGHPANSAIRYALAAKLTVTAKTFNQVLCERPFPYYVLRIEGNQVCAEEYTVE